MPPDIGHRQRDEFSERSGPIDANAGCVRTQMPSPRQTIAAASTCDMPLTAHDVAGIKVVDVRSDLDDLSDKFMSDGHRHRNGLLCPLVPLIYVNVGSADTGVAHADQHVVDADGGFCDVFQP